MEWMDSQDLCRRCLLYIESVQPLFSSVMLAARQLRLSIKSLDPGFHLFPGESFHPSAFTLTPLHGCGICHVTTHVINLCVCEV